MTEWLSAWTLWLEAHPQWLGLAILLVACTECLAIVGLLMPGTVLLFALAVMAGSGVLTLWHTLLLAFAGGLIGDLLSYLLGRNQHQSIRRLPYLREHPHWLGSAERYFQRYGVVSLLVGRFIGPLRPLLPMVAGMLDMPFLRFLLISLLASAGWSVAYLLPGWSAGAALRLPLPPGFWLETAIVVTGLAVLIALAVQGSLRGMRHVSQLAAALSLLVLGGLLLAWPLLTALDRGVMELLQAARTKQLDGWMVLVTGVGDSRVLTAAAGLLVVLLLWLRQCRAALFAASSMALTALLVSALKALLARPRPQVLLEPLHSFSLPSGHSSAAFIFFLVLGVLAGRGQPPRWRVTWLLLAGLPASAIALSRVYLGVHWTTDVLAGGLLAGAVCAACLGVVQRHESLSPLPAKFWWLLLPLLLLLFAGYSVWHWPVALALYQH